MAMPVSVVKPIVGVDVAKDELVIYQAELDLLESIPNDKAAIKKWLKALPAPVDLAIESTNTYHLAFADMAHEAGCTIYMVGGYELSHYRKGVKVRAKTDALDAKLLARYLKNEYEELHPWIPPSPLYRRLLSLSAVARRWFKHGLVWCKAGQMNRCSKAHLLSKWPQCRGLKRWSRR